MTLPQSPGDPRGAPAGRRGREMTGIQDEPVSARLIADLAGLVNGAVLAR